jgi:hypothetical protein
LLTIVSKVNILAICRIAFGYRGYEMKKTKTARGFMSWLFGHGWDTAGGNG